MARPPSGDVLFRQDEASLLDLVDNLLNRGVVLQGELTLSLADVDLVYARLAILLCAADLVLPARGKPQARERGRAARRALA